MNSARGGLLSITKAARPCSHRRHCFSTHSHPQFAASSSRPSPKPLGSDHLTPHERESKQVEQQSSKPPPYLSKAPGLPTPPRKGALSREEWRANFLSPQRRLDERKHLVKQVSKGYFNDYNELRHKGGKSWIAPKTLIRDDLARYFPDIEGVTLSAKEKAHTIDLFPGKISVVTLCSFKSSEEHINSFVRPIVADLKDDPLFQYVYINVQENPLKSFLVSLFLSSLRRTVPIWQHPTYLVSHQSLEYLREPLGMDNQHVGYVFLVDEKGRVRWAGCEWATREEEEALRKCGWVLLKRLKGEKEEVVPPAPMSGEVASESVAQ